MKLFDTTSALCFNLLILLIRNLMRLFILFIFFLLSATFHPFTGKLYAQPLSENLIRVAILKEVSNVSIEGEGLLALPEKGAALLLNPPILVSNRSGKLLLNGKQYQSLRISAPDKTNINGKNYRGVLELMAQNNGILVINELPLEDYLIGVINSEISSSWPMEVIKVQAVIARTYAVAKREERQGALFHLESTVMDQAYDGSDLEDSRAAKGVHETEGQVLTYNGTVIQAFYHANSGGKTEASQNVWGMSLPYLQGVDDKYGLNAASSRWEQTLPLSRIASSLQVSGYKTGRIMEIRAGSRNNRDRISTIILYTDRGTISIPATKFRMAVGSTIIKSTNFTVNTNGNSAYFKGRGYGHGVGLCQWGSRQRALDGFKYTEILSYYYPGTRLSNLSDLQIH